MSEQERPVAFINSRAPIRICDNGCWTDTWFAGHGEVFNVAVSPHAEVQVAAFPMTAGAPRVVVSATNYGDRYEVRHEGPPWGAHPLLEAAIASMPAPRELRLEVEIHSDAPPGAGTGTSSAVTVALLGALDALTPGRMTAREIARAAHRVETERLGRQSGVQDQLAAACGGINLIEIREYPEAVVTPVDVTESVRVEFEKRLLLVYLGKGHDSSAIHQEVIRTLEASGPDSKAIAALRGTARHSAEALAAGDFGSLGRAMIESTEAQRNLHPSLISPHAEQVIEIARAHHSLGWKVNGAGGDGGSLSLLCGDTSAQDQPALVRAIEAASPRFRHVPIRLSDDGLRVWSRTGADVRA